jgi:diaminopimelate epimerase
MIPFIKMNGSGNDFVIFDAREGIMTLTVEEIRTIANRDNPVTKGCDQIIVIESSEQADAFMRIYNADGSEVNACGNATRCVADLLEKELGRLPVTIQTNADILTGVEKLSFETADLILVDMGKPKLSWEEIPLSSPFDEASAKIHAVCEQFGAQLGNPAFVSMGNPHVIFFQEFQSYGGMHNPDAIANFDIEKIGSALEHLEEVFPERVNVTVASVYLQQYEPDVSGYRIQAKVWERGAGNTKACGTAACAMMVAVNQVNQDIRRVTVEFANSGEEVNVLLDDNNHVLLGGLIQEEFRGTLDI